MLDLMQIAERRMRLHRDHKTNRPLSEMYEFIGLVGEYEFAFQFFFQMDTVLRPGGDGHVDFNTPVGTIDVKTARKAYNLIVEVGKPIADIVVLASFDDTTKRAILLGWEYGRKILQCPVRDFGYGVMNHYLPAMQLRSIAELQTIMESKE